MRKLLMGSAVVLLSLVLAVPASAGPPAHQGCVGESVSANVRAYEPNYGAFVRSVTPRNDFGSFGAAVQAAQAGLIPDEIYPNTCND